MTKSQAIQPARPVKEVLLTDIKNTFSALYQALNAFSEAQINSVPFAGSWTPGQVAEHILLSVSHIPQWCHGGTETLQRSFNEKTPGIKAFFLDFSVKFQSPDFIIPGNDGHHRNQLLEQLRQVENQLADVVANDDLTLLCTDFELPGMGPLTRYEWIDFGLTHTQRHIHQLDKIFKTLTKTH